jgi:hypothetical protein
MMPQSASRAFAVALAIACAGSLACSFSYSSEGSSDSSNSSSDSSGSSSGDSKSARFQKDVEQYTEAFVQAGGQRDESFFTGLGDLARKRGVSDWEAEPGTWEAIGRGLGRTRVTEAQRTAWETAWAGGDQARQDAIARGFAATR